MESINESFDLNNQFNLYLERVGLKGKKLPINQYRELKRCFIGACGQMLILLRDEVGSLENDEAMSVMEDMMNQVGDFFLQQSNRHN